MEKANMEKAKKLQYESPELTEYGTLQELTQAPDQLKTGPGDDAVRASFLPN